MDFGDNVWEVAFDPPDEWSEAAEKAGFGPVRGKRLRRVEREGGEGRNVSGPQLGSPFRRWRGPADRPVDKPVSLDNRFSPVAVDYVPTYMFLQPRSFEGVAGGV